MFPQLPSNSWFAVCHQRSPLASLTWTAATHLPAFLISYSSSVSMQPLDRACFPLALPFLSWWWHIQLRTAGTAYIGSPPSFLSLCLFAAPSSIVAFFPWALAPQCLAWLTSFLCIPWAATAARYLIPLLLSTPVNTWKKFFYKVFM